MTGARVLVVGDVMTDIIVVPEGPLVRGSDQLRGDAHVERDRRRAEGKRGVERVLVEGASGVVDGERPVRPVAQLVPLGFELVDRPHRRADAAQRAGPTHRRGELDQTLLACIDCTTPVGAIVGFEFDDLDPDAPGGLAAALSPIAPSLADWLRAELGT